MSSRYKFVCFALIASLILVFSLLSPITVGNSEKDSTVGVGVEAVEPDVSFEDLVSIDDLDQPIEEGTDLLDGEDKRATPGDYIFMNISVQTASGEDLIDDVNFRLSYEGRDDLGDAVGEYELNDISSDYDWSESPKGTYSGYFETDRMMRFSNTEGWDARVIVNHERVEGVSQQQERVSFNVDSYVSILSVDDAYAEALPGTTVEGIDFSVDNIRQVMPQIEIEANSEWRLENSPEDGWVAVGNESSLEADGSEQGYAEDGSFSEYLEGSPVTGEDGGYRVNIYYSLDVPMGKSSGIYYTDVPDDHPNSGLAINPTHIIYNIEK